jgi:hypothetical protein
VRHLRLKLIEERLTICRLDADATVPPWATGGAFSSVTRTGAELSIVCREEHVPDAVRRETGWRIFRVEGPLPFNVTGVLAAVAAPLAAAEIPIFAISTFDTDYILVKEADTGRAAAALIAAGHAIDM